MYLSDEEINRFRGTGEVNAAGDDLETFLAAYNPDKYKKASNTVDTLVFTYNETQENGKTVRNIGKVLLIKRGNHPSIGWWALPGGFVDFRESLDVAALRELREETGIEDIEVCQLRCYGNYDRDPRTHLITTAYVALVPEGSVKAQAGDDACDSGWFTLNDMIASGVCKDGIKTDVHKLMLHNESAGIWIGADVEVTTRVGRILPQKNYKVIGSNKVAADHGAIILEGYHYVKELLKHH
ncbi:MAG: NUDIX hydrolase [Lachnospira sp.]|nr:NUDIX hydrolase [Lachnospira sp.]